MSSLRKLAHGQECQIRIPGVCEFNPETTVLCHYRMAGDGMGRKGPDERAAFGCSSCHDIVDGRVKLPVGFDACTIKLYFAEAVFRTWDIANG